jgi:hypothetical protein
MAKKKPKPKPVPAPMEPAWWERLTTRVSRMGVQEWAGAGVFVCLVALGVILYVTR